jgi:putative DNA primase/helicase
MTDKKVTPLQKYANLKPAAISIDLHNPNEDSLALAFESQYRDLLRYDHTRGKWYAWDGIRWQPEETKLAFSWARDLCREHNKSNDKSIPKYRTAGAVEKFCQSARCFAVTNKIWDLNPWLLTTPAGTVDLKTGELLPNAPNNLITLKTLVSPEDKPCPAWKEFLSQSTQGDQEYIRFLQQIFGYCLTADTREHVLFFIYGPGGNGKSVFLNVFLEMLNDYAKAAAMSVFARAKYQAHPQELAGMDGPRLVTASEVDSGQAWAEARIKALTGGDPITARFMRQDEFTFIPKFKLLFSGNHKPRLNSVDDAARRRFRILPFVHKPKVPDLGLPNSLKAEYPAILKWAIEGCLDWQKNGLIVPEVVKKETAAYFDAQDIFNQWLEDRTELKSKDFGETSALLFKNWSDYATNQHEEAGNLTGFREKMERAGYEYTKNTPQNHGIRGYKGISLKAIEDNHYANNY